MANISIRGLDDKVLAALEKRAATEDASVNTVVLRHPPPVAFHRR